MDHATNALYLSRERDKQCASARANASKTVFILPDLPTKSALLRLVQSMSHLSGISILVRAVMESAHPTKLILGARGIYLGSRAGSNVQQHCIPHRSMLCGTSAVALCLAGIVGTSTVKRTSRYCGAGGPLPSSDRSHRAKHASHSGALTPCSECKLHRTAILNTAELRLDRG
jgi:hypothetical protein